MDVRINKAMPVLAVIALVIAGIALFKGSSKDGDKPVTAPPPTYSVVELPKTTKGEDSDTPTETLNTLVASTRALEAKTNEVMELNKVLLKEREDRQRTGGASPVFDLGATPAPVAPVQSSPTPAPATANGMPVASVPSSQNGAQIGDVLGATFDKAVGGGKQLLDTLRPRTEGSAGGNSATPFGIPQGLGYEGATERDAKHLGTDNTIAVRSQATARATSFKTLYPLGYEEPNGKNAQRSTRPQNSNAAFVPGNADAANKALKETDVPFYTIPENATMAGVVAMTAIVGRVPIDGKVTDPMQFKAIIGRNNLAANGWELPADLEGVIISGVAVGDMALSCSEGKIKSMTFVFQDGTIRTVSQNSGGKVGSGSGGDLGYVSDIYGNPCIPGKFVTNAPTYISQIVGVKTLGVAAEAYAKAQTTTVGSALTGQTSTSVTGDTDKYVLGKAASEGANEISAWLMQRLKNSFDAVVTPAGAQIVVHIDRQIAIDKETNGRKIVHQFQTKTVNAGNNHGLD